jgi:copper transport protein
VPAELTAVRRLVAVVLLASLWLLVSGTAAGAHALLQSSDPPDGASVDRAPQQLTLTFTERPERRLSTVQVLGSDGRPAAAGKAEPVAGQPQQLRVPLGALADGTYTVAWRVLSRDDGHVSGGTFAFGVGVPAPTHALQTTTGTVTSSTPAPTPLATTGRWLLYCGLALLLGAAATGLAVFDRRLPARARSLLLAGAGLAVTGLVARVAAERAAVGVSLGDLVASDTGQNLLMLADGVLASAFAAGLLATWISQPTAKDQTAMADSRQDRPGAVGWGWLAAVGITAAATMATQALAGHAAAASTLRPLSLLVEWLHLLAAGIWAGGLVWLLAGLIGPTRLQESPETATVDTVDRGQAVLRFSRLALPVVGVLAVTGLNRALDLAGGWAGLTRTGFGRVLDLKLLLFAGLLLLAARNRYRLLPALAGPAGRLDALRRSVTGEIALVAAVLMAAALLTQLPPGKFTLATATARPRPPANIQVRGSDATTSVRLALTATPGTAGANQFTAKVSDYDNGQPYSAQRVTLRFALPDRPEISSATLELARADDDSWQANGRQLSIDGRWRITALVQGPGAALTVPLELRTRTAEPTATASKTPAQPQLHTINAPNGGSVRAYVDPGRAGPNTVHFSFFTKTGSEQPIDGANATMTSPSGQQQKIDLQLLTASHFAANLNLPTGQASFTINATPQNGPPITARFTQQIK